MNDETSVQSMELSFSNSDAIYSKSVVFSLKYLQCSQIRLNGGVSLYSVYTFTRDVTIIDINRLSVAKAFRFSIIDSQISQSIVFDTDHM